jgi:hypothetical protein
MSKIRISKPLKSELRAASTASIASGPSLGTKAGHVSHVPPVELDGSGARRRSNRSYAAGVLTMSGPYVAHHKHEILDLIRDATGDPEQPESRISVTERPDRSVEVTFAAAQQARDIGRDLYDRFGGELDVQLVDGGASTRIFWWR